MNLEKLENNPDFAKMQEEILEFWEKDKTFEKSVNKNREKEVVFYDGPPFPTGKPHHGTVLVSFIKDMIARYWTMQGYSVPRVWGWDCHGLPIETQAEKLLEITDKKQIETEVGIEKFNECCHDVVAENNDSWKEYVREMCRWVDYDNAYKTMNTDFMESVLWAFKEAYNKGLIYQDYRVTPYCYRCETALSISDTRESDSTRPKQDTWCIAKFKTNEVVNNKPVYLLAWTTTPWTLFSNMALAVNENFDYAYVEVENEVYIAGKTVLSKFTKIFGEEPKIVKNIKGKDLENMEYEPICNYFMDKKEQGAFRVILADFVELDEGVGIVHIAPGFGEDDYWACKKTGIPLVCPVDEKGRYLDVVEAFKGRNVMEANMDVLRYLKSQNKVILDGSIVHNYPHCWRCKTPLIYKSMNAWYFNVEKVKDKLVQYNEEINWVPETVKQGRFGNWIKNARDWNISRNRYWSTPIPIWECNECGKREVLGSIQEIADASGVKLDNLHRQYMDKVTYKCECSGTMKRVPEVLDCWFESASVPFAQKHYPFENKEWFESHFPCDFIVEYTGQIRCWFYYLHVLAVALFDKPAFKNCVVHGTILAKDGKKLSKSSKNYTDPMELMKKYGTDAFRLYLFRSNAIIMNDLTFDEDGIKSQVGQVLLPLYNCAKFFDSYAVLDNFVPDENKIPKPTNELDKWILAKLFDTQQKITKSMEKYELDQYVEPIIELLDGFSNWYIRRSRRRFWTTGNSQDKQDAYETTFYVLVSLCKLLAPITPVISEKLYKHFTGNESVHLADVQNVPENLRNDKILEETDVVQRIISLARFLREKENIKNRQPLSKIELAFTNEKYKQIVKDFEDIICEEINVKQIVVIDSVEKLAKIEHVPNFKTIGPKFGMKVSKITNLIKNGEFKKLEDGYEVSVDNENLKLDLEDVIVRYLGNGENKIESDKDIIARLDTLLTEELKDEGMAREIVRNIQDARKQLNCEISDRILIELDGELTESSKAYICNETLADLQSIEKEDFKCEVRANGKVVYVKIKK